MRRHVVPFALLAVLAAPSAAVAHTSASTGFDGTVVVKNGAAPQGTPVVTLVIRGAAIGQVTGPGRIVIRHESGAAPEVTGYDWSKDKSDVERTWRGVDFKFRAVGGLYKITIWGSGVDLVASGVGTVILTGSAEAPLRDGTYSVNGGDFRSLPALPTRQFTIGG
jgi:hypothetical protein